MENKNKPTEEPKQKLTLEFFSFLKCNPDCDCPNSEVAKILKEIQSLEKELLELRKRVDLGEEKAVHLELDNNILGLKIENVSNKAGVWSKKARDFQAESSDSVKRDGVSVGCAIGKLIKGENSVGNGVEGTLEKTTDGIQQEKSEDTTEKKADN